MFEFVRLTFLVFDVVVCCACVVVVVRVSLALLCVVVRVCSCCCAVDSLVLRCVLLLSL